MSDNILSAEAGIPMIDKYLGCLRTSICWGKGKFYRLCSTSTECIQKITRIGLCKKYRGVAGAQGSGACQAVTASNR